MDGLTASAASETLAALLHYRPEVQVIGSETAGPCLDHIGEIPAVLTMPNFGIAVLSSLALIQQVEQRGCQAERGTLPDVAIEPSPAQLMAGEDPVLERALELAAQ